MSTWGISPKEPTVRGRSKDPVVSFSPAVDVSEIFKAHKIAEKQKKTSTASPERRKSVTPAAPANARLKSPANRKTDGSIDLILAIPTDQKHSRPSAALRGQLAKVESERKSRQPRLGMPKFIGKNDKTTENSAIQKTGDYTLNHALELYTGGLQVLQNIVPEPQKFYGQRNYNVMVEQYERRAKTIEKGLQVIILNAELIKPLSIQHYRNGCGYDVAYGPYLIRGHLNELIIEEPLLETTTDFDNLRTFIQMALLNCTTLEFVLVKTQLLQSYKDQAAQKKLIGQLLQRLRRERLGLKIKFYKSLTTRRVIMNNGFIIECDQGLHVFPTKTETAVSTVGTMQRQKKHVESNYRILRCCPWGKDLNLINC